MRITLLLTVFAAWLGAAGPADKLDAVLAAAEKTITTAESTHGIGQHNAMLVSAYLANIGIAAMTAAADLAKNETRDEKSKEIAEAFARTPVPPPNVMIELPKAVAASVLNVDLAVQNLLRSTTAIGMLDIPILNTVSARGIKLTSTNIKSR